MANNKFLEETGLSRFWSHVKKLVFNNAYRPNLLINGDFQCWQRADSFLVNNTIQPICDMWKMWGNGNYGVSKVSTDAGKGTGLTWNNAVGSIIYILPDETFNSLKGKKITISYSKNKTVYTYQTITVSQKKIIDYNFKLAVGDVLNWIRADEGDIAYPHVKEDYATALLRCKRYIERYRHLIPFNGTFYISGFKYDVPKESNPTVTFVEVSDNSGVVSGTFSGAVVTTDSVGYIYYNLGSAASLGNRTFSMIILVSCEPL